MLSSFFSPGTAFTLTRIVTGLPRGGVAASGMVTTFGVPAAIAGIVCSHEFNNILTTIINYAKLGLRTEGDAARIQSFEKILKAGQRAATLVNSILGFARNTSTQRRPTDIVHLVEEALLLEGPVEVGQEALGVEDVAREEELHLRGDPADAVLLALTAERRAQLLRDARDAVATELHHLHEVALRGRDLVRVARSLGAVHDLRGVALIAVDGVLKLDLPLRAGPLKEGKKVPALALGKRRRQATLHHRVAVFDGGGGQVYGGSPFGVRCEMAALVMQ